MDLAVRPAAEVGGEPHPVALLTTGSAVTVALVRRTSLTARPARTAWPAAGGG